MFNAANEVAVAAFLEQNRPPRYALPMEDNDFGYKSNRSAPQSAAGISTEYRREKMLPEDSEAGTGYGETRYSPVREVSFEPESFPYQRLTIRYDWPENLRRYGIHPGHPRFIDPPEPIQPFTPPPPR